MGVYINDKETMEMLDKYRKSIEYKPSRMKAATKLLKQTLKRRLAKLRSKK